MTEHSHLTAKNNTIVSVDAMGGDHGPSTIIAGLLLSTKQHSNIKFLVHGPEDQLAPLIEKHRLSKFCTIELCETV